MTFVIKTFDRKSRHDMIEINIFQYQISFLRTYIAFYFYKKIRCEYIKIHNKWEYVKVSIILTRILRFTFIILNYNIIYWYKILQQINYEKAKIYGKREKLKKSETLKYYNMHIRISYWRFHKSAFNHWHIIEIYY